MSIIYNHISRAALVFLAFFLLHTHFAQSPHGQLALDCKQCHVPEGWQIPASHWQKTESRSNALFDHASTGFALTGRHESVDCRACHANLEFTQTESACITCHQDIHAMTVGVDCSRCHHTQHWLVRDMVYIHVQNGFPLRGAHLSADCGACHMDFSKRIFHRLDNTCVSCHQTDYQASTNPNHGQSGYSTDCATCHVETAWRPANFGDHDSFWPLTGKHAQATCAQCHQNNQYSGTPTSCIACHQSDFAGTQSPNHQSAGFSTDCSLCHTTQGWQPASWDHDSQFFPIYKGEHKGEWDACTDCHTQANDYSQFSCLGCHKANDTSNEHDDVNGYQYQSSACYTCHPDGKE